MKRFFKDNNFKFFESDIDFDKEAWCAYTHQLKEYNIKHRYNKFIELFAKIISCFGVTKYNRQIIREYIKHIFCAH